MRLDFKSNHISLSQQAPLAGKKYRANWSFKISVHREERLRERGRAPAGGSNLWGRRVGWACVLLRLSWGVLGKAVVCIVMEAKKDGPYLRDGRGLEFWPMPSLRAKAHDGGLCTFSTRTSAAGIARRSQLSSLRQGKRYGQSGQATPSRTKTNPAKSLFSS
jgi:hypothetical protein